MAVVLNSEPLRKVEFDLDVLGLYADCSRSPNAEDVQATQDEGGYIARDHHQKAYDNGPERDSRLDDGLRQVFSHPIGNQRVAIAATCKFTGGRRNNVTGRLETDGVADDVRRGNGTDDGGKNGDDKPSVVRLNKVAENQADHQSCKSYYESLDIHLFAPVLHPICDVRYGSNADLSASVASPEKERAPRHTEGNAYAQHVAHWVCQSNGIG